MFVDQPSDVTVTEYENAAFSCSVVNSSFGIYWLVNDTDAQYEIFRQEGITVLYINDTISRLVIVGYKKHNNTVVHCVALKYHNHDIVAWISSEKALLVVLGKCTAKLRCSFQNTLDCRSAYGINTRSHVTFN